MFKFKRKIYSTAINFVDSIIAKIITTESSLNTLPKVLVIRLDLIGDFFLWLDSAKELKTIHPSDKYTITLLANHVWYEVAKDLPYWDDCWALDPKKFKYNFIYRIKSLIKIRQAGFDTIIYPAYSREFLTGDSIVNVSKAKEKSGFNGDNSNITPQEKSISDTWYNNLIPAKPQPLMEIIRNAEFIKSLGYKNFQSNAPKYPSAYLKSKYSKSFPFYVLSPGASLFFKQWPVRNFAKLAEKIFHKTGWKGVICGNKSEIELSIELLKQTKIPLENSTGKTSLSELLVLLKEAQLVIGNDSGVIHMASAVSTKSICILGGGHFGRFMPYKVELPNNIKLLPTPVYYKMECYNCNWNCTYKTKKHTCYPCINNISVNQVWEVIENFFQNKNIVSS